MKHTHITLHVLAQVRWLHKLIKEYKCSIVEMEHSIKNPYRLHGLEFKGKNRYRHDQQKNPVYYIVDVYGETKNGEVFIVEIGKVDFWKKVNLKRLAKDKENTHVIFVTLKN